MKKIKAEGYRINGFFCEIDRPVVCDMVGLSDFEIKYANYSPYGKQKIPVPKIQNTGTLYHIKFPIGAENAEQTEEYLDEDSGLIFQFYHDNRLYGSPFVLVVKEVDLNIFFHDYFQLYYYEQNKIPGKRFFRNLLKWTGSKDIKYFVKKCNTEGKKLRKDPKYSGNPDWDGTLDKDYTDKLMEKAATLA